MNKYLIIILLFSNQAISIKCANNSCEFSELKDEVKCTHINNKISIELILNELIINSSTFEIRSLDLSFNKLNNIINNNSNNSNNN